MKRICTKTFCVTSAVVLVVMTCGISFGTISEKALSNAIPGSCTIFTASYGEKVFFGNNEDYSNPKTYYWVHPSSDENYGGVYFGFDNFWEQGGINEKGLCYDWNALPEAPLNLHSELPPFMAGKIEYGRWILNQCATVEEAIELVKSYSLGNSLKAQIHLADATGDAVVISAGPDGEFAFTRKQKGDGYLVSTNFNRANPENAYSYPCWRYDRAVEILEKIEDEDDLTVDYFKSVLDAVHVESASGNTLYSNIFDLRNGIIYLYHWHQFDEVVTLDVAEQIAGGPLRSRISKLFSRETVDKALAEYRGYQGEMIIVRKNFVLAWMVLVACSVVALIWNLARGAKASYGIRAVWVLVVALFGPFGLLVYYFSYRRPQRSAAHEPALENQGASF
jgi:hypothetical protein